MKILFPLLFSLIASAPSAVGDEGAVDSEIRYGEYVWNGGEPETVEVELEPTRAGRWNATFRFTWNRRNYTWVGSLEGDLENGELRGTVQDGAERRLFRLEGSVENGRFVGTHADLGYGAPQRTGTLTFGPQKPGSTKR